MNHRKNLYTKFEHHKISAITVQKKRNKKHVCL